MLYIVEHVVLNGKMLMASPEYQQLTEKGFYVTSITWVAQQNHGPHNRIEFEAGFEHPKQGKAFRYNVRGLYRKRKGKGYTKTLRPVDDGDKQVLFPHIELWDPPRSTQSYISKLLEFNNFEVAIEPLSIDLIQWATAFELSINQKITIDFIQISGFEIERGVTAKIVVSGDKDVRDALQRIAKTKTYQLDKIHLKLFLDGALIPIQLANSGSVKLEAEHVDPFLSKLRSSLLQAQKNTKP